MNKILFFAHLRDAAGEEAVDMNVAGLTVSDVKKLVAEKVGVSLDAVMTAVNEEFATDDEVIQEQDIIAFIPPVSGG